MDSNTIDVADIQSYRGMFNKSMSIRWYCWDISCSSSSRLLVQHKNDAFSIRSDFDRDSSRATSESSSAFLSDVVVRPSFVSPLLAGSPQGRRQNSMDGGQHIVGMCFSRSSFFAVVDVLFVVVVVVALQRENQKAREGGVLPSTNEVALLQF